MHIREISKKDNRVYLLPYISEFIISIFVWSFFFVLLVYLPHRPPKSVPVLLLVLILLAFGVRMANLGIHKYDKVYVQSFNKVSHKKDWITSAVQIVIALALCFILRTVI